MRLLFVHGRSQGGKDPVRLLADWREALERGLAKFGASLPEGLQIDFPFYGDRLDQFAEEFDLPADAGVVPKGSPVFDAYLEFRARVAEELQLRAGIADVQVNDEMQKAPVGEKGPQNWEWVQAIIRLIDRNFSGASQSTIELFLRDVFIYTRRLEARRVIDGIVAEKLHPDTAVVVGHSLGSVVAYNILKSTSYKVPLYVTVGSPLAVRAIRSTLEPVENPAGAKGWQNAFDKRDVVALYPLDSKNFDVDPAIMNYGDVNNWTDNRHGIVGYLDDANVAKAILSGL